MAQDLVQEGIAAYRSGDKARAKELLVEGVKADPGSEQGWYYLAILQTDAAQRKYALEQVIRINPNNQQARDTLAKVTARLENMGVKPLETEDDTTPPPPPKVKPTRVEPVGTKPRDTSFRLPVDIPGAPLRIEPREVLQTGLGILREAINLWRGGWNVIQDEKIRATWWRFWLTVGTGAVVGSALFAIGMLIGEYRLAAMFPTLYSPNIIRPIFTFLFGLLITPMASYVGCTASYWYATQQARGLASRLEHSQVMVISWLPGQVINGALGIVAGLLVGRPLSITSLGFFIALGGFFSLLLIAAGAALTGYTLFVTANGVRTVYKLREQSQVLVTAGFMVVLTGLVYTFAAGGLGI
jgi:hypothetical protein